MTDPAVQRELGRMEAQIAGLTRAIEKTIETVDEMKEKIDKVEGGWRTLIWLGGAVAGLSAFVGSLVTTYWPFR